MVNAHVSPQHKNKNCKTGRVFHLAGIVGGGISKKNKKLLKTKDCDIGWRTERLLEVRPTVAVGVREPVDLFEESDSICPNWFTPVSIHLAFPLGSLLGSGSGNSK